LALIVLALVVYRYYRQQPAGEPGSPTACDPARDCFQGSITRITDGDTLEVNERRVRLVLVDAPERNTPAGPAATRYLEALCPAGSQALVYVDSLQPRDDYGRTLGLVWCGGRRVNEEMIRSGRAALYRRFCGESVFGLEPWAIELGCR
jgi:endonuclease YncB( thermonuclease family)